MWRILIALRYRLTWNYITKSPWRIIGFCLVSIYVVGLIGALLFGMVIAGLHSADPDVLLQIAALACAVFVLIWLVFPILYLGADPTVDPRNYAVYAAPSPRFARALLMQAIASPGSLAATLVLLTPVIFLLTVEHYLNVVVSTAALVLLALLVSATAHVISIMLLTRVNTARKARAGTGVLVLFIAIAGVFVLNMLPQLIEDSPESTRKLVEYTVVFSFLILRWVPGFGLLTCPELVLTNNWINIGYNFIAGIALLLVVSRIWERVCTYAMLRPDDVSASGTVGRNSNLLTVTGLLVWILPVPAAAVAARELRYYRFDSRYLGQFVAVGIVMALGTLAATLLEDTALGVWLLYLAAPLLGTLSSASAAMDSTAWWMQVAAPIRGVHDRLGRFSASGIVCFPILLLIALFVPLGIPQVVISLPQSLALVFSTYLLQAGLSQLESVTVLYPVKPPGTNMFASNTHGFSAGAVLNVLFVTLILAFSYGAPYALIHFLPSFWAITSATILGIAAAVLGIIYGGKIMDRRSASILASITNWPGHKIRN